MWCGVCKDNDKVVECSNNGVINRAVNRVVDGFVSVDGLGDKVWMVGKMRKRLHGLYPMKNPDFTMEF